MSLICKTSLLDSSGVDLSVLREVMELLDGGTDCVTIFPGTYPDNDKRLVAPFATKAKRNKLTMRLNRRCEVGGILGSSIMHHLVVHEPF